MAIILVLAGHLASGRVELAFSWVFWLTVFAVFMDAVDGPVARFLKAQSPMGAQLDNLCDATTFGLAVGLAIVLFLKEVLDPRLSALSYLVGFLWFATVLIRLARFQVDQEGVNPELAHYYFRGLCSPVAALLAVSFIQMALAFPALQLAVPILLLLIAFLMISSYSFADLPKHYLGRRRPIWEIVPFIVVAPFISIPASIVLYLVIFILASLGRQFIAGPQTV